MELLRRFRKKPRYSDMLPDDVLIKIFESLTIGERLKAERTCTRWSYLTKLTWSHTTCEEVCNYFMKKRRLTADRVILVLSRCAQYLTHICLNRSHHAIKGIENEEKAQELFEVLRRKARKLERIQWDFNVPADTLVKFYFTRINLLENFDNTGLFKEIEFKKLLDLLERARNLKFYTWNVGNGELRRINYAQTVFDKLPHDLKSLKVNCTVNLFWMKIIIQHLHKFENLTEFSMRGTLMYTQNQADRRSIFTFDHNAQLPAWLEQVEIDGIFPDDKINFLRKLKSLRHLSLTFGSITLDDLHLLINNNPQLEHLVLRKMDDFEEEKFEIVSQLPNLKFLRLENLPRLEGTSLMNCKQIQVLHMSFCDSVLQGNLIGFVAEAINLREIRLKGAPTPETHALRRHLNTVSRERNSSITLEVFNPVTNIGSHYSFPLAETPRVRERRWNFLWF